MGFDPRRLTVRSSTGVAVNFLIYTVGFGTVSRVGQARQPLQPDAIELQLASHSFAHEGAQRALCYLPDEVASPRSRAIRGPVAQSVRAGDS